MDRDKILRYLNDDASLQEVQEVESWIGSSKENTKQFNYLKARYTADTFDETEKTTNVEKGLKDFKKRIDHNYQTGQKRVWAATFKYAAIIAVIFGLASLLQINKSDPDPVLNVPDDAITLKLENGNVEVVKEDGTTQIMDSKGNLVGTQQGSQLIYKKDAPTVKLSYNTLQVPYGKRFDIILSDSTHVILNAGTSIKYPVKFIEGHNREVSLTGEAFFEVTKDAEHPFIVNTHGLNIRVLGTRFNVSAYPEDNATNTVLVEGSVALYQDANYDSAQKTLLTPGHLASMNKTNGEISTEKTETSLYTAWTNGNILFRHIAFNKIIKKLERHFNVVIINKDEMLGDELFTASFKNPTLEQILNTFKDNYGIEYTIDNNKITINP